MACTKCGCKQFEASQNLTIGVYVDEDGNWEKNIKGTDENGLSIEEWDDPHGPFVCCQCREDYEEVPE